jgi:hypothetical protein
MDLLLKTFAATGNLHHAYLLEGEREKVRPHLLAFFEDEVQMLTRGNPDFWYGEFDTFGIEEGRIVQDLQSKKAFDTRKVFVIALNSITHEAQNSLLKVFEEPTANTHFFVLAPSIEIFLPTVLSRLTVIRRDPQSLEIKVSKKSLENVFLETRPPQRLELLKDLIEDKEKSKVILFLNNLEKLLKSDTRMNSISSEQIFVFDQIIKCRGYLYDRSPSIKMILEHLSLIIPVMKSVDYV